MVSVIRRRKLRGTVLMVALLTMFVAGLVIGHIYSPPDGDALEEQSRPVTVWANAEERVVSSGVTLPGTVKQPSEKPVTIRGLGDSDVIVRQPQSPGETVRAGQLLVVISGRPYIGLSGPLASYRDLQLGDSGDDVTLLQRALSDAGYSTRATGTVTRGTINAARRLFKAHGFDLPAADTSESEASHTKPEDAAPSVGSQFAIPAAQFIDLPVDGGLVVSAMPVGSAPGEEPVMKLARSGVFVESFADLVSSDQLQAGQEVHVQSGQETVQGSITKIGEVETEESGDGRAGRRLTIELQDPPDWRPEMSVTVRSAAEDAPVLAVPQTAVRTDAQGDYLLVRSPGDSPPRRVDVTVTGTDGGYAAIDGALEPGAEVKVT